MSKFHDDKTIASDPIGVSLDPKCLEVFKRDLGFWEKTKVKLQYPNELLDEHLRLGDSRAALVMQIEPILIVAAYSDELDCVVLLEFPYSFVNTFNLKVGKKLLTVNTYSAGGIIASDLKNGESSYNRYNNFYPLIADFLSDNAGEINRRIANIEAQEWDRITDLSLTKMTGKYAPRDGSPYRSGSPKH